MSEFRTRRFPCFCVSGRNGRETIKSAVRIAATVLHVLGSLARPLLDVHEDRDRGDLAPESLSGGRGPLWCCFLTFSLCVQGKTENNIAEQKQVRVGKILFFREFWRYLGSQLPIRKC